MVYTAHERGERVLLAASFDSSQINSSVYRQTWVKEQVSKVEALFTDGINVRAARDRNMTMQCGL